MILDPLNPADLGPQQVFNAMVQCIRAGHHPTARFLVRDEDTEDMSWMQLVFENRAPMENGGLIAAVECVYHAHPADALDYLKTRYAPAHGLIFPHG